MLISNQENLGSERSIDQHGIFFLIAILTSMMLVKYPSQEVSAFEKHNIIIPILMVTLVIYGIAWPNELKLKASNDSNYSNYQTIVGHIRLLSSYLAIVLLMVMLVPIFGWVLLGLWVLLLLWVSRNSYKEFCQMLLLAFNLLLKMIKDMGHHQPNQLPMAINE